MRHCELASGLLDMRLPRSCSHNRTCFLTPVAELLQCCPLLVLILLLLVQIILPSLRRVEHSYLRSYSVEAVANGVLQHSDCIVLSACIRYCARCPSIFPLLVLDLRHQISFCNTMAILSIEVPLAQLESQMQANALIHSSGHSPSVV